MISVRPRPPSGVGMPMSTGTTMGMRPRSNGDFDGRVKEHLLQLARQVTAPHQADRHNQRMLL
jgi:hypothetical protein